MSGIINMAQGKLTRFFNYKVPTPESNMKYEKFSLHILIIKCLIKKKTEISSLAA